MILYNISIIVEDSSHDPLLVWLQHKLRTSSYDVKFLKMLDSPHEGTTYCLQLTVQEEDSILSFQEDVLADIQNHIALNHSEKAFIFDSKMKYISL
ncbi:DUF4286 family protein [Sphingobacterium sp. LRF_L2]|uniref:DUF4286 family protein n=1 Tax=Sphingobacterium sp. LRF_L2 TaxID=3369421 RepID=UPI003F5E224D